MDFILVKNLYIELNVRHHMNTVELIFLVLSILGIIQGLILIVTLNLQDKQNRWPNLYISLCIFFMMYLLLEFLLVRRSIPADFPFFFSSRYGAWFLIGPLMWLYTVSIIEKPKFNYQLLLHFLPFLVLTLLIPLLNDQLISRYSMRYGMLTLFKYFFEDVTLFQKIYTYVFVIQFLHSIAYMVAINNKLKAHANQIKNTFSNIDQINLRWLKILSLSFIIVLTVTIVFYVLLITGTWYHRNLDYIYMLPMLILIYLIGFYAIKQPSIFNTLKELVDVPKYKDSSLTLDMSLEYKDNLLNYMKSKKPYQNSELKLQELAEAIDINPRHLSQLINEQFHLNFFDFINEYRIEEAKLKLKESKQSTILEIAYEVGFNNKTSFNNYFKKLMKMTPTQYRASWLKQLLFRYRI